MELCQNILPHQGRRQVIGHLFRDAWVLQCLLASDLKNQKYPTDQMEKKPPQNKTPLPPPKKNQRRTKNLPPPKKKSPNKPPPKKCITSTEDFKSLCCLTQPCNMMARGPCRFGQIQSDTGTCWI